jgi:hypothetical protein
MQVTRGTSCPRTLKKKPSIVKEKHNGRGKVHRYRLAKLLCLGEKREKELAARLGERRAASGG